ncbi:phospholipase D family protein, partial [uncultured Brevundimonas sp.]|uniref:phospholipase D family protein n=1 Tax=uncultured Brevundimonas sp. TaxID=213418 RepID=UPI0025D4D5E9
MTAEPKAWPATGYLDALRPGPDCEVESAILAAYSADPISIVAALLALIGRDDEDRPMSRRDLADAIEALRDRVRVVVQRGRLAKMRNTPRLAGVLDQFVRDVPFDERRQSWHPKAALVRLRNGKDVEWRLWVGSRNLTTSENRDLGLLLVSGSGGRGRGVPGAADLARALADRAGLPGPSPAKVAAEVASLRWRSPAGVRVDRLRISRGENEWSLPDLPKRVDALTVVSPFLDAGYLSHVRKAECAPGERRLLSTLFEIERLAATCAGFGELLALDAPDYPAVSVPTAAEEEAAALSEGEEVGRGLHAKLLHIRQGERRRFWVGSANATCRAWTGRNVEIIAELSVDETVEDGLLELLRGARPVRLPDGVDLADAEPSNDRLDRARIEVSARWQGEIHWDAGGLRLRHPAGLHPSDPDIRLDAGLITTDLVGWPSDALEIDLGVVEAADWTELVQLRLTLDGAMCEWIVQAPATPAFGVERDRAAFMRLMGARDFLLWIADCLRGAVAASDGPDWTDDRPERPAAGDARLSWTDGLPTQEEILSVWTRNPEVYASVRQRVQAFLPALLNQTRTTDPNGHEGLQAF